MDSSVRAEKWNFICSKSGVGSWASGGMKIVKISKPQSAHTWAAVYAFHLWLLSAVFVPVSCKDFWILNCQNIWGSSYRAVCCLLSYCPLVGSHDFWVSAVWISVAAFTVQSCLLSAVILPVGWQSWILGFQLSGYLWQYLQSCQLSPFLLSSLFLGWKLSGYM